MADSVQLRIENFRAFRSAFLDLSPNSLTLVAGPNNVGKSALLSALDVVARVESPVTSRHAGGDPCRIWARWQLTDDERYSLLGTTSNTDSLMEQGAASWLEWEFGEFHDLIQPLAVAVRWPDREPLEFARMEDTGNRSWSVRRTDSPLAVWDGKFTGSSSGSGGSIQDASSYLGLTGQFAPALELLAKWRQGYFHFKPLREAQGRYSPLSEITPELQSTGANLAKVLLYMHNNRPDVWARLVSLVQQIVPGVGALMTPVGGNQSSIVFQDEQLPSHTHNLKDLGTGVEQLLMTLVVGLTQTAYTIVLEEPETGLHPGAQRALLGLLHDWSRNRTFVASTHSATMLDWTSPSTSVVSVSRAGLDSTAALVTTERASVLRDLGVRISDVLSAEFILILEGPTDKEILDIWFPDIVRSPRVAVVDGGGGYNARHADLFVKWLETADQLGVRRVLYARDRDELSAEFLSKLEASRYVFVLPCRELENLLLDFDAVTEVINQERVKSDQAEISPDEVRLAAGGIADSLKSVVVLKRVMAEFAEPVRLVDHKLRRRLAKARADEEALKAAVLERLPQGTEIEASISEAWQAQTAAIEDAWGQEWLNLAPGADLLVGLWKKYLGRGYSKSSDGVAIARHMASQPASLARVLDEFMAVSGD
jgi:energy-coupling factor transporter ATP-binding protein EcfA2